MPWFKVDDQLHAHPKLAELEGGRHFAEALSLWVVAGSWCASQLTDGDVPSAQLRRLVPFDARKAASELVRVHLWEITDTGYRFRSWHEYQPRADDVRAKREADKKRKSDGRAAAKARTSGQRPRGQTSDDARTGDGRPEPVHLPRPDPTRPDPGTTSPFAWGSPGPGRHPSEQLVDEYVARYRSACPGKPLPMVARSYGHPVWAELVAIGQGLEGSLALLDAAFQDGFVQGAGFTPNAIRGAADRIQATGPKPLATPRGSSAPTLATHEDHQRIVDAAGGDGYVEQKI